MNCDFPDCEKPVAFHIIDEDGDTVGYECEEHAIEHVGGSGGELRLRDAPRLCDCTAMQCKAPGTTGCGRRAENYDRKWLASREDPLT